MLRISNEHLRFFMNSSLVTIEGKLDSLTASFWHNLGLIYSQISQLWVSTKGPGGWPTSDFTSLLFLNTLLLIFYDLTECQLSQPIFYDLTECQLSQLIFYDLTECQLLLLVD